MCSMWGDVILGPWLLFSASVWYWYFCLRFHKGATFQSTVTNWKYLASAFTPYNTGIVTGVQTLLNTF